METPATTAPRTEMVHIIKEMYLLIKGRGISGFMMMGARHIVYDNERFMLQWQMGEGASVDTVQFFYDEGLDLYRLRFIKYANWERTLLTVDKTFECVYVEDVRALIERETGFYLSF